MRGPAWTEEEKAKLEQVYATSQTLQLDAQAALPGRSANSIVLQASRMGISSSEPIEEDAIRVQYPLVSKNENSPLYIIVNGISLFSINNENSGFMSLRGEKPPVSKIENREDLFNQIGTIFHSSELRSVALHFLQYRSSTSTIIQRNLNIRESSVYRHINTLIEYGLIKKAAEVSIVKPSKSHGPPFSVFALYRATKEDVNSSIELQKKLSNPLYLQAEAFTHTVLEDYLSPSGKQEIKYRDLLDLARDQQIRERGSVCDLAAGLLVKRGIQVWR